jgi:hypothetical protein
MIGFSLPGEKQELGQVMVVALYDPNDGTIRHLHTVTTLVGALPSTDEEAIAAARTHAARRHANVHQLAVAISDKVEHGREPHCIDLHTKAFVPTTHHHPRAAGYTPAG